MTLLPSVPDAESYWRAFRAEEDVFAPAAQTIADRHGITRPLERCRNAGNVVYLSDDVVIKLLAPLFADEHIRERAALRLVHGQLGAIRTPGIVADDSLEGWPYLVLETLPGSRLSTFHDFTLEDRVGLAQQVGTLLAAIHALQLPDGSALPHDWPAFVESRLNDCEAHHRRARSPEPLLVGLSSSMRARIARPSREVLVHADVHDGNLMAIREGGRIQLTGLLDFGDALTGDPIYDLATPAEFICGPHPQATDALLSSYAGPQNGPALRRTVFAYMVLHRFTTLSRLIGRTTGSAPETLSELEARYFTVH